MLKRRFLLPMLITASSVFLLGWFTSLQGVARNVLLSIAAIALFPFLLIAVVLFLAIVIAIVAAFAGGDADLSANVDLPSLSFVSRYYQFLANQKNPTIWGAVFGGVQGALLLWLAWALFAMPGESRTAVLLADTQKKIEAYYKGNSGYPSPTSEGHFAVEGETLLDGFGRPVLYETSGAWKLSSYKLRSLGYDGERSSDDICVVGSTKAAGILSEAADMTSGVLSIVSDSAPVSLSVGDSFSVLKNLQCQD
jgi:hypothetical protein